MSRFNFLMFSFVVMCFTGCAGETPTPVDSEVPEAASVDSGTPATSEDDFQVLLDTTKGKILLEVHPAWSPKGAERFKELVELGFYDDVAFFRVIDGFMAQVGINGDPALHAKWKDNNIMDDPVVESNKPGYVSFAKTGLPNSRSTQFFINFGDNSNLDGMGFSPFAKVIEGMDVVNSLYKGYGEGAPRGRGPDQMRVVAEGNAFLKKEFPMMDYIKKATIVGAEPAKADAEAKTEKPAVEEEKKPAEPATEKKAKEETPKKEAAKKEK